MLEAYLDESEAALDRRQLLVLAGYLAPFEKWLDFSDQWTVALSKYNLTHFHATDIRTRHSKLYRHLSFEDRRNLLEDLADIIARNVTMGFAIYMFPGDWKSATTHQFRCENGSAYGICMELLLWLASCMLKKPGEPERVSIFLEDGHKNAQDAILRAKLYKDDTEPVERVPGATVSVLYDDPLRTSFIRIGALGLVRKIDTKPVQAADLFAYLASDFLRSGGRGVFEGIFNKMVQAKPHAYSAWNAEKVSILVRLIQEGQRIKGDACQRIWRMSKALRALGFKVSKAPGALVVDRRHLNGEVSAEQWKKFMEVNFDFEAEFLDT
jgi:hypothetical protein